MDKQVFETLAQKDKILNCYRIALIKQIEYVKKLEAENKELREQIQKTQKLCSLI